VGKSDTSVNKEDNMDIKPTPDLCPTCGGTDVQAVGEKDDDPHQERMTCDTCASTWVAIYEYTGYTDLVTV
jgi:transposase-like protein